MFSIIAYSHNFLVKFLKDKKTEERDKFFGSLFLTMIYLIVVLLFYFLFNPLSSERGILIHKMIHAIILLESFVCIIGSAYFLYKVQKERRIPFVQKIELVGSVYVQQYDVNNKK